MTIDSPREAPTSGNQSSLTYRKGLLGDLMIVLEVEGRRIQIGSVPVWEDQERVMDYIDRVNRLTACKMSSVLSFQWSTGHPVSDSA